MNKSTVLLWAVAASLAWSATHAASDEIRQASQARVWERDDYASVQVNVATIGEEPHNIEGDAANEPSIVVDPTDPSRMSIGWRQFDTIESDFRQSGWATSHDGGRSWPYAGTLTPGAFGTDPVLAGDAVGNFFYVSVNGEHVRLFRSFDSGITWEGSFTVESGFRDKPWMAIDHPGGNIYVTWNDDYHFARSADGGNTFSSPVDTPLDRLLTSTVAIDPHGVVYIADESHRVARSLDAQSGFGTPTFEGIGLRVNFSELYYAYSTDGGVTWSANVPVSPPFDSFLGWPQNDKLGDYYHTVSDNEGVDVAYAATFNGEQDIYYLRIGGRKP